MIYLQKEQPPNIKPLRQVDSFTLEQMVLINDIWGYVEFIGEDVTILVDNQGAWHTIKNIDIKEVYSNEKVRDQDHTVYYIK